MSLRHISNSVTRTQAKPRIAIVGGGIGGLSLLATLSRLSVPATLYERDASPTTRSHLGGQLDLHYHTGQRLLRENGLESQFHTASRREGEEARFYFGTTGELLQHTLEPATDPELSKPEIDRRDLYKILLDACPPDAFAWGHSVASVSRVDDAGQHELHFADGSSTKCDLLVGTDGAFSRVRPLVSEDKLAYTGLNGVEISLAPDLVLSSPESPFISNIGLGSAYIFGSGKFLYCQRNGDNRIRVTAWMKLPEEWRPAHDPADVRKFLLKEFASYTPWVLDLIRHSDPGAIYHRPLYALPVGHSWKHQTGVTIIGDAAHLMPPAGAGANLAMIEGLELGKIISEAITKESSLDTAIASLEATQAKRATDEAKYAADGFDMVLADDGDAQFKELMAEQGDMGANNFASNVSEYK